MELLFKTDKKCYNFSDNEEEYVKQWTNNETIDRLIRIVPGPLFPHSFYTEWNQTHYQWCGYLFEITQYFAQTSKTR